MFWFRAGCEVVFFVKISAPFEGTPGPNGDMVFLMANICPSISWFEDVRFTRLSVKHLKEMSPVSPPMGRSKFDQSRREPTYYPEFLQIFSSWQRQCQLGSLVLWVKLEGVWRVCMTSSPIFIRQLWSHRFKPLGKTYIPIIDQFLASNRLYRLPSYFFSFAHHMLFHHQIFSLLSRWGSTTNRRAMRDVR